MVPNILSQECKIKAVFYLNSNDSITLETASNFTVTDDVTSISSELTVPLSFSMTQNFPNPFNPSTTIKYGLAEASDVTLIIYDIAGRKVAILAKGSSSAGRYEYTWNGLDESGDVVSAGIYLARLNAGINSKTIKMLYLK